MIGGSPVGGYPVGGYEQPEAPVSGGYTLTCLTGSYSYTGQSATITYGGSGSVSEVTGGGYIYDFRDASERLRRRKKRIEEMQESEQEAKDAVDREIARLLHDQEMKAAETAELSRLKSLVDKYADHLKIEAEAQRVNDAFFKVKENLTIASFERLAREIERAQEEEEYSVLLLLLDD